MKKFLLGAMLMLASFAASAASVSITNPTISANTGSEIGEMFEAGNKLYTPAGGIDVGSTVELSWDAVLTGAASAVATFNVSSPLLSNWSFSIAGDDLITNGGFSSVTAAPFEMIGGIVYTIVLQGTALSDELIASFAFPISIEVSEVPLPAAVWLFGSVLLGGLALRRRSQKLGRQQAVAA